MEKQYKKVSFRIDTSIYNDIAREAERQYLSVSAYIRKQLEKELNQEDLQNEIHERDSRA